MNEIITFLTPGLATALYIKSKTLTVNNNPPINTNFHTAHDIHWTSSGYPVNIQMSAYIHEIVDNLWISIIYLPYPNMQ